MDWKGKRGQKLKRQFCYKLELSDVRIKPVEEGRVPAVGFPELRPVSQAVSPQLLVVREKPLVVFTVLQVSL